VNDNSFFFGYKNVDSLFFTTKKNVDS